MQENNHDDEIHYCPLREQNIDDGDCFETVMAILGLYSKEVKKRLQEQYPNCEDVCSKCQYNKERDED